MTISTEIVRFRSHSCSEIFTGDDKQYLIRPVKGKGQGRDTLIFDVKCSNDAHVALLSGDTAVQPMIEIFIGGWGNKKSAIRLNQNRPDKAEEPTPDVVCGEEHRRFWIRFKQHLIQVGREGDEEPFLSWMKIPSTLPIMDLLRDGARLEVGFLMMVLYDEHRNIDKFSF